jgi:hypothetical protein
MASGRPAEPIKTASRETRQFVSPFPVPWAQPSYGFQQQGFGEFGIYFICKMLKNFKYIFVNKGRNPLLVAPGTPVRDPVQERFGLALLLSLLGGGGGDGDGDGDDDRFPWNFRPFANLPQPNPQPFFWPVTTTLG